MKQMKILWKLSNRGGLLSDFFKEQLVKKEFSQKDRTKRLYIIGIAIAVAVFVWQICSDSAAAAGSNDVMFASFMMLGIILVGIIVYIAVVKIKYLNCEFEYAYTNGSFDVDVIMNKSKRKTVFQGNVTEFEIFAHVDDREHLAIYSNLPAVDLSSGRKKENTYVFVANYKNKKKRFIIEPCEEILKAVYVDLSPRRAYIKK